MSSTNRGGERRPYDFYATPEYVVENLLQHISLEKYGDSILEPSAGNGCVCKIVKDYFPEKNITAIEIRDEEEDGLKKVADDVLLCDFLEYEFDDTARFDIIIGNPPYSNAIEFVEKSLRLLNKDGVLIFLLRTAFLESKSRYEFWQNNPLSKLFVLSRRPSFTGKGTDSTCYSWFVWDKSDNKQEIKVI